MLPKILKNFNVFVDGRGYAGKISEITLPKLSIKTEEYLSGGMDVPIAIDMGMEKLEAELTFAEYDLELLRLFGLVDANSTAITLRGAIESGLNASQIVINIRGQIKELDFGSWKAADKATLKCTVSIIYYRLTLDGNEVIEIDALNMVRKINGIDQMSSYRKALGI